MASSEPLSSLEVGPQVRIRLPPAGSQERTPHRRCTICGVGFTDVIRVSPSTANRCARPQGSYRPRPELAATRGFAKLWSADWWSQLLAQLPAASAQTG